MKEVHIGMHSRHVKLQVMTCDNNHFVIQKLCNEEKQMYEVSCSNSYMYRSQLTSKICSANSNPTASCEYWNLRSDKVGCKDIVRPFDGDCMILKIGLE